MELRLEEIKSIASNFNITGEVLDAVKILQGHINITYRLFSDGPDDYILQRVNTKIFKDPDRLMDNIHAVTTFIANKVMAEGGDVKREVLTLIPAKDGGYKYEDETGYYRIYIFIKDATSHDFAVRPILFRNSAKAFGKFQKQLSDFPAEMLHETIKDFHNTVVRYQNFKLSVQDDLYDRARDVGPEIEFVNKREDYYSLIVDKLTDKTIPLRVTHNDTKLNNIMMDNETDEGVCVIDLDTVMPGSALYDFGDSIRFGASSAAEDEKNLSKVNFVLSLFEEYTMGFLEQAGDTLTEEEIELLPHGAIMMTIECGMRFLTDHLDGDKYFALHYEGQNLDRARTQFKLVTDMEQNIDEMAAIVKKYTKGGR